MTASFFEGIVLEIDGKQTFLIPCDDAANVTVKVLEKGGKHVLSFGELTTTDLYLWRGDYFSVSYSSPVSFKQVQKYAVVTAAS